MSASTQILDGSGARSEGRGASGASVNNWRVACFTLPAIPIAALGLPLVVYIPPFYVQEMGVSAAWVGLVFMFARFWDMFTDPPFGYYSDHIPTRWGRRKPWILLAAPILMLCIWQIFMPPEGAGGMHLFLWLLLLYIGWTMISIAHMSWGAELSPDYHERARIQGWRESALIGGMIAVLALPALVELVSPEEHAAVSRMNAMSIFLLITIPITVGMALFFVPGRPEAKTHSIEGDFGWRDAAKFFAQSPALRRLLFADIMVGLAPGIVGALYLFAFDQVFQVGKWTSILLLIYFCSGFLAIPFWIKISGIYGKHRALAIAMLYGALALPLVWLFPRGEVLWFVFGNATYGFAYGAGLFLLRSMMADFADLDHLRSGKERTGMCYALLNMTNKIGYALSVGMVYPLLTLIDFDASHGAENSEATITSLLILYTVPACIFMLAAAWAMWNFPIDKNEQERIRAELAAKKSN